MGPLDQMVWVFKLKPFFGKLTDAGNFVQGWPFFNNFISIHHNEKNYQKKKSPWQASKNEKSLLKKG
jgi:hypothetical protein